MTAAVTFVCCVEAGPLELMTARMIASLRRWGGRFAAAPVLAVTPRRGPQLLPETHELFQEYGVRYVRYPVREQFSWNNFMNKPHALLLAEQEAETPCLAWLDSDILILGEPGQLALEATEAFAACAPDKNVGTAGPEDVNDPYWRQLGQALQVEVERLPWIVTAADRQKIRLYFNSGVFVFRREMHFAAAFLEACRSILQARISSKQAGIFFTDQVALGLTAFRLGLPYRLLDHDHNFAVGSKSLEALVPEKVREVKILHHHDAMWPPLWPRLLEVLRETHPEVYRWLQPLGPLTNPRRGFGRVYLKVLQAVRSWQQQQFVKTCHSY
jgi:hypothetical protein